ncbi:MAG: DNA-binding protein WhiA [Evtepia sp.]
MSFSADTKAELCRALFQRRCCAQEEVSGILLYSNQFTPNIIKIVTESTDFAKRLPPLFRRAFQLEFDTLPHNSAKLAFTISDPKKLAILWDLCGYDRISSVAHHINFAALEESHCRQAFLRGVFLAGGSLTDPQKGYHLELVTSHFNVSRELTALLLDMDFSPKMITRKSNYITYFKQSERIEEVLTVIGAPIAAMAIMNAKLEKNLRNGINRQVNCDAANVGKIVDAAQDQILAIHRIETTIGLDSLSEKLREVALLRKEFPELALSELAALCNPPITKSCLNHRLRKLVDLGHPIRSDHS